MIKCTSFEEIMNFNRSYIVYHTYSLNNKTFLTWTLKDLGVMKINKKKMKQVNFLHSKVLI